MLTQRSRYGLRAMMLLAKVPEGGHPLSITRMSEGADVPKKFLELIMTELRGAGLVKSIRGKQGGFLLAKPPHLISFGDIIRVIEGPLALIPCVSRTAYKRCDDCRDEETCEIRRAMLVIRDDTARILDNRSLADAVMETRKAA